MASFISKAEEWMRFMEFLRDCTPFLGGLKIASLGTTEKVAWLSAIYQSEIFLMVWKVKLRWTWLSGTSQFYSSFQDLSKLIKMEYLFPLDIILYNCGIQMLLNILLKQIYLNSLPCYLRASCFSIGNFHRNPRWEIYHFF